MVEPNGASIKVSSLALKKLRALKARTGKLMIFLFDEAISDLIKKYEKNKEEYFKCKCPDDLKNGKNGFYHRIPIECVTTKKDIAKVRAKRTKKNKRLNKTK